MSTCHLSIEVGEHLGFRLKTESSVKTHNMSCGTCANKKYNVNSFKVIKKCNSNFETKIYKALLIKNHYPRLDRQLYANRLLFFFLLYFRFLFVLFGFCVMYWRCGRYFAFAFFIKTFDNSFCENLV